jgi:LuxR family maltose regulon positive regulatory protein
LNEIRAADLRFTPAEAAAFLNEVMGLSLSAEDIAALETRTEGWIAGLQLAALSMQGRSDVSAFIKAFTGSHVFVVDYLVEEVLQRQPESVQTFLLQTSILLYLWVLKPNLGPFCAIFGQLSPKLLNIRRFRNQSIQNSKTDDTVYSADTV